MNNAECTPVVCLALPTLFDAVVARFETDNTYADNVFGWREPPRHKVVERRIVWVPGDPAGAVGDVGPARNPGDRGGAQPGRSLATLRELFTVHVSANDPQFPEDERAQYVSTRLLFDAWLRAVYLAAHGTFEIVSLDWNTDKNERRHGAELKCVCWIEAMIPDSPYALAPVDTEAQITTSLDDVDEVTTTASP